MKNNPSKPLRRTVLEALLITSTLIATAQLAQAQTTTWVGAGADQNWTTAANWTTSGGSTPPAATDNVIFPNGSFPVSPDGYDNIVTANTTIGSLSYLNTSGTRTTHLNDGATLTVNGPFSVGVASSTTVVTMSGGGNFTVNNISGTASIGGSGGSTETVTLNLADGANTFNVKTLSLGESASNNGRTCNLNLGNGATVFNADSLQFGTGKGSGLVQWGNATTNGSLTIRDHTGSGRATMLLGNGTSGSGASRGTITGTGRLVNILAGTITLGRLGNDSANQIGTLIVDDGVVDATSILMGVIPTTGVGTGSSTANVLTIGGNETNTAVLTVGSNFVICDSTNASRNASATFNLLTNGTANVFCSITKQPGANNIATLNISGTLNMQAATNTIGTRANPMDNVNLDFAVLNVGQDGSSVSLATGNLTMNDTNVINFVSLPPIIALPMTIPVISYTSLNVLNMGVGTLPGDYHGHLVDDGQGTISLVIDSGTVVAAKHDIWVGGVSGNWDVSSLNWTNSGLSVTNYTEADFVAFDDTAVTGNVTLLGSQHTPSGMTVNNNTLNYVWSGAGKISGSSALVKSGAGSLTLSETGGDNFSGGVFVHGGTLVLDAANSNLSGGLTNDPGTTVQVGNNDNVGSLPNGLLAINGTLVFNQANNHTFSAIIGGTGSVVQNGSNTVTLTGANTYSGNTIVAHGTLALSGDGSIVSPVVAVQDSTLNINTANSVSLNAVKLTNSILNVGLGTNSPNFASLNLTNSTINLVANYNSGGVPVLAAGALTTGGITNVLNISNIQNLPLSPALPFNIPLISYSSASFPGGFNIGWTNLPGISGYITNNSGNNSIDLVITNAPAILTWNGGSATGNNWSDAANWTGVGILPLDSLTFDGLLRTNNNNDTAAGTTYVGITFNNNAGDAPFTLNGNPINLVGEALNNSVTTQTIKLGLLVSRAITNDGGSAGGSLFIAGGVTNTSASGQTVALLNTGVINDLWSTNNGTNGGGQLTFQLGDGNNGGSWTVADGTGTGALVQGGNIQLSVNAGAGGGTLNFGDTNTVPNLDAGYPSNGVVTITGAAGTFNMNNGTLKANAVSIGNSGTVNANFNLNGGTIILGPGSFTAGGGNGATVFVGTITNGALYSTNGGTVILAQRASGTLSITGGLLDCNTLNLSSGTAASGVGTFNLSGGRLVLTNISVGSSAGNGWGTLNFNGGILQPATNTAALFKQSNLVPLTNNVQAGGAIFDTAGFNATVNWPLQTDPALGGAPDGGLVKLGAGTLSLTLPDSFIGDTLVGAGTLLVNSDQGPSLVTVSNGATLGGNGAIGNNLTVNAGGTLAPGNNAVGVLTVNGNVTLGGTTMVEINKTGNTNDLLLATNAVSSTITYGGTLNVTTVAGTLALNDSFKLFSATNYAGAFSAITPATPGSGLAWNTNNLAVNGTLSVVVGTGGPTTNATITSVTLSGSNLLVHGTNNNIPNTSGQFVVLTSTNITTPLSQWTPVSTNNYNSTGTLDFSVPVVPGTPREFIDVKAQ